MKAKRQRNVVPATGQLNICGARIRLARRAHQPRLSQAQLMVCLARQGIHLDRSALSCIENHERAISDYELKALAHCLGTTVAVLIDEGRRPKRQRNAKPSP